MPAPTRLGLGLLVLIVAARVGASAPGASASSSDGRALFEQVCAPCHGVTGAGNGPVAFAVRPRPRNLLSDPFKAGDNLDQVFGTITKGLPQSGMASFAQLAEADRWALARYVVRIRSAAATARRP